MSEVGRTENSELIEEVSALIVSNKEHVKKLGRISYWMLMNSSPLYSRKRSHERLSEVSVPVMAQSEEAVQPTEAAQPT